MTNIGTFMKLTSVTPGTVINSDSFGYLTLPGVSTTLSSIPDIKRVTEVFGWRDDTQPEPAKYKPSPARLATQATNYVKSVYLRGFLASSEVSEEQVWLRVYREIYSPSIDPNYIAMNKALGRIRSTSGVLPSLGQTLGISKEGYGSLYSLNTSSYPAGQYQLLWLRWGSGGGTQNGVLIDYYFASSSVNFTPPLDVSPSGSGGFSRSGSNTFRTSPLNTHSSYGINGYYMGTIQGDASGTKYFLQDDPANPIPILQASKSLTVNKPTVISGGGTTFSGGSLGLFNLADTSTIVPLGTIPGASAPLSTLIFCSVVLKKDGKSYVIAVTPEIKEKIDIHIENMTEVTPVNFSSSGGKALVGSGSNQNYIGPNLKFSSVPSTDDAWDVTIMGQNQYTRAVVVSGSLFTEVNDNVLDSRDDDWIAGYEPAANTNTARFAARENYWYVLPEQVRTKNSGQCRCSNAVEPSPLTKFTSPSNISPCTTGFHWGKFLKYSVNASRGFHDYQLSGYVTNINNQAKNYLSNNLVTTSFQGVIVSSASAQGTGMQQVTFRLSDVPGIQQGSSSTFPKTTSTAVGGEQTTIGADADQTGANVTTEKQWTGPPRDWKKTITEATDRLLSSQTVDQLTPDRLSKFLSAQVSLGAPLAQLKESVLASILAAKLVALQSQGKTRKVALAELKDDPVYQSLVLAINATKAAKKDSSSNSSASGATNPGGDEKNTKTIRISVVRGLPGYRSGARPTASIVGQPELVQTYEAYGEDGKVVGNALPRRFVFPFVPKEVTYSGIGTQWTEIARSGNYPIVDWTGFNLLKISFNFDIVDTQYRGQMGFGLSYSCEESITTLRQMAQTPYPVTFLNMDKFMTDEVRWPLLTTGRGIEFVISEFSVTAVQRTGGTTTDKSAPNQISRATCSMTLQEIPIETVNIVQMPPIKPCKKNCKGDDIVTGDKVKQYLLWTSGS